MTRHVLVIDDDDDIRTVTQYALEATTRWRVTTAGSGELGLDLAERLVPDAVLLDVMMPGLDGPTTARRLRSSPATAHIPIVFLTASPRRGRERDLDAAGVAGVLMKPFDPLALASELAACLDW